MQKSKSRAGFGRWLVRIFAAMSLLAMLALAIGYLLFRQSLPVLEGSIATGLINSPVTVSRDAEGVPTILAQNRNDASYVLGFIHAQERFFQMDLLRRAGAGELSELLGDGTLNADKQRRRHRFRFRSQQALSTFEDSHLTILDAYTAGVNDGLTALGRTPFEYTLLGVTPSAWENVDTMLAVYAMYFDLQDEDGRVERNYGLLYDVMGQEFAEFIVPKGTSWDAPIDGGLLPEAPIPPSLSLPVLESGESISYSPPIDRVIPGSNNWVVGGALTGTGAAIVADDMHLGLSVPNIWYRTRLLIEDTETNITGVTLPGVPAIVVGSNTHIAWGFTNSQTDTQDIVQLKWLDEPAGIYATPAGPMQIEIVREEICSSSGVCEELSIQETIWGPVLETSDHRGRTLVTRWIAHDVGSVNLNLAFMENAKTIEDALLVAHTAGSPAQNMVVGDTQGNIAYTLLGPIPSRFGHSGLLPSDWSDGTNGWNGRLTPPAVPVFINPPGDRLWSANARMLSGDMLATVGFGNYALAGRQHQIRERLQALESADEDDMLAIQLDDEALFLARWRTLLLGQLSSATDPAILAAREQVANWEGRAIPESIGYRIVRRFRSHVTMRIITSLTRPLESELGDRFPWYSRTAEGPVWRLVSERPAHLLPTGFDNWEGVLSAALDDVMQEVSESGGLSEYTWGQYSDLQIHHPLSRFLPGLAWLTDPPHKLVPGEFGNMPRIGAGSWGASQRMVVSPGHEENGYFNMPSGQSGHPLSPYFNKGHENWLNGNPSPFLPKETKWTLSFVPVGSN